jgi:hypothetical protein
LISDVQSKRTALLSNLLAAASDPTYDQAETREDSIVEKMAENLVRKRSQLDAVLTAIKKTEYRQIEVEKYH